MYILSNSAGLRAPLATVRPYLGSTESFPPNKFSQYSRQASRRFTQTTIASLSHFPHGPDTFHPARQFNKAPLLSSHIYPPRHCRGSLTVNALSWPLSGGISIADDTEYQPTVDKLFAIQAPSDSSSLPQRKTKIVATIGPTSNTREAFFALADAGMNVVRLNMSHGTHESHGEVIELVREYNSFGRGNLAIMLDTKGPEVRSGDVHEPLQLSRGDKVVYTISEGANGVDGRLSVNYDGFIDDVAVGDTVLVDGGIMSMEVISIDGNDVNCKVIDGGTMGSRRHLNIRGKSANLPAITDRDWADIKFGVENGVDYFALSFVRDAEIIIELKEWLRKEGCTGTSSIGVLAKIESADSVQNLEKILDAVDGAMVARGDLGAELPVEEVPYWQNKIVQGSRKRGKPVIVATNMLESMIQNATPTRAEVSDIAVAVREGTDAVMLSGETAYGAFPQKALEVMCTVAKRTEHGMLRYSGERRFGSDEAKPITWITEPPKNTPVRNLAAKELSEIMAYNAVHMADTMKAPLVVFSRKGTMPTLLSHYRPTHQIFCFTDNDNVQRRLALHRGVTAFLTFFSESAEATFDRAIDELKERKRVGAGDLLVLVQSGTKPIWRSASMHAVQVRQVPEDAKVINFDSDSDS